MLQVALRDEVLRPDPASVDARVEADLAHLLAWIPRYAGWQAALDGAVLDWEEYADRGREALLGCLERWDPTRAIRFKTYAEPRVRGAIRDALAIYTTWQATGGHGWRVQKPHVAGREPLSWEKTTINRLTLEQRLTHCAPAVQHYARAILDGMHHQEYAATLGISPSRLAQRLGRWRAQVKKQGL